jgi:hypothetical protein
MATFGNANLRAKIRMSLIFVTPMTSGQTCDLGMSMLLTGVRHGGEWSIILSPILPNWAQKSTRKKVVIRSIATAVNRFGVIPVDASHHKLLDLRLRSVPPQGTLVIHLCFRWLYWHIAFRLRGIMRPSTYYWYVKQSTFTIFGYGYLRMIVSPS